MHDAFRTAYVKKWALLGTLSEKNKRKIETEHRAGCFLGAPLSVDPAEVSLELQLEIIDLQVSSNYKTKHRENSLQHFYWSPEKEKYKNLIKVAVKMNSILEALIYAKQTFSIMNINKSK